MRLTRLSHVASKVEAPVSWQISMEPEDSKAYVQEANTGQDNCRQASSFS